MSAGSFLSCRSDVALPPGLEVPAGAGAETDPSPHLPGDAQSKTKSLCDDLMSEVDRRVTAKVEEVWQRAGKLMAQAQRKHTEQLEKVTKELASCSERQQALEAENSRLTQLLLTLAESLIAGDSSVGSGAVTAKINEACSSLREKGTAESAEAKSPRQPQTPNGSSGDAKLDAMVHGAKTASTPITALPSESNSLTSSPTAFGTGVTNPFGFGAGDIPALPPFPFAPQAAAWQPSSPFAAPSFSLSKALGVPPKAASAPTPLSLANSLGSEFRASAPSFTPAFAPYTFNFTMRRADNTDLGLVVSSLEGKGLRVDGIRSEGAIEAWNKQCAVGAFPEKTVLIGDMIVAVNDFSDPDKMLEQCLEKTLLKISIARGGDPSPPVTAVSSPAPQAPSTDGSDHHPAKPSSLRAGAAVFVPGGNSAASAELSTTEEAGSKAEEEEEVSEDASGKS
eukprot:TRINITY_DN8797_c0_g1_i1.p1 TRINITY_DN8797_c0_g1~~TRINITY_DN8797_c0_g1_i1.p1  ORF type:complete len:452 (+),score=105.75 TRINITY_DN8797_c0_g1_i1:92-1447(+)